MVSRGVDPVGRESAMLRIAVVQSDSRVCDPLSNSTGIGALPYWWQSIMMNAQWASQRGYSHLTYCISRCVAASGPHGMPPLTELHSAWCKLPVLFDALQSHSFDTVLYLDSDAFWNRTGRGLDVLHEYTCAVDWSVPSISSSIAGSIFFGCNLPWAAEDRGRRRWNRTLENGAAGPPNTGVILVRHTSEALTALATWWLAALSMPRWAKHHAWEQSALWELWRTRSDFARSLRVLASRHTGECMRTMDLARPSPIVHAQGGGNPRARQIQRDAYFRSSNRAPGQLRALAMPWSTQLVHLGEDPLHVLSMTQRRCAQYLHVRAGVKGVELGICSNDRRDVRAT